MKVITGKVVLLGASGVGKTSAITRYVHETFNPHLGSTIGAAYFHRTLNIDEFTVKLQIWDTAGMERFRGVTSMYYRKVDAALVFFDITSLESFQDVQYWIKEIQNTRDDHADVVTFIVGNKVDLVLKREVDNADAKKYAREVCAFYDECSALNGQGIEEIFEGVAQKLVERFDPKNCLNKVSDSENNQIIKCAIQKKKFRKRKCC